MMVCKFKINEDNFEKKRNSKLSLKRLLFTLTILIIPLSLLLMPIISAHCPLCTTGAAVGVGVARFYGIDDSIVGLWIGALIASSGLWLHNILKKKINIPLQAFSLVLLSFFALTIPLYIVGIITNFEMVKSMPNHHSMFGMGIYGIDKLLFGMILGTFLISGMFGFSDYIKMKKGKVLFSFQGMVFMFVSLIIFSLILWFLSKP